jgi:hypothetical protein
VAGQILLATAAIGDWPRIEAGADCAQLLRCAAAGPQPSVDGSESVSQRMSSGWPWTAVSEAIVEKLGLPIAPGATAACPGVGRKVLCYSLG